MNANNRDSFNQMVGLSNRAFARRRNLAKAQVAAADPRLTVTVSPAPAALDRASAFDEVPAALLIGDMEGNLLDANQAAYSLLGYSPEHLRRMTVLDLVAARPEWTQSELGRFCSDGFWRGDVACLRPNDSVIEVATFAKRADVAEGSSFVAVLQGISRSSERSEYGDRIQQAALDLREAPTTMAGIAMAVRQGAAAGPSQNVDAALDEELSDILALAALEHRRLQLARREADFAEIVDLSVEEARRLTSDHRITLSLPRGAMSGLWDVNRVVQVIAKLLKEAAQHSNRGGDVHVSVTESESEVIFGVALDQRITPRQVPKQRALQSLRSAFNDRNGSLYLPRLLIEEHGGRIWSEGTAQDDASAVYFALPRWPGDAPATPANSAF